MKEIMEKKGRVTKATIKEMNMFELVNKVVELTSEAGELVPRKAKAYITELQERMCIDNPYEIAIMCAFLDQLDNSNIQLQQIASHFGVRATALLAHLDTVDDLLKRKFLRKSKNMEDAIVYRVSHEVLDGIKDNKMPQPKSLCNIGINDFINEISDIIDRARANDMGGYEVYNEFIYLINNNQHLYLAQRLKQSSMSSNELMLYLCFVILLLDFHTEVRRIEAEEYIGRGYTRSLFNDLVNGSSVLIKENLVESSCVDGQVDPSAWTLTDFSKYDILRELNLAPSTPSCHYITECKNIKEKKLFYNARVSKEVSKLHDLLNEERMKRILTRMDEKGLRKGFTCIFHGGPGTGKTETVLQLAKQSGRDIMLVDVPNVRSKWVGDSEKNIKGIFDQYRRFAKDNDHAPILVFNEADALLTKRSEGSTNGVDKMENAMQNIILQEMENLEGIMIATTNLTGNLDPAFERRFLYKIEFDKPTAEERKHIWKSMMPDLTDGQSLYLAKMFDFSGGQIENIVRKRVVNDILEENEDVNMEAIIESCEVELLHKKSNVKLGFI